MLNIAENSSRINLERQTLAQSENDKAFTVLRTHTHSLKPQVLLFAHLSSRSWHSLCLPRLSLVCANQRWSFCDSAKNSAFIFQMGLTTP